MKFGAGTRVEGLYTGDLVDDKRHGKGKFAYTRSTNKGHIYKGDYKDDLRHGYGTIDYVTG